MSNSKGAWGYKPTRSPPPRGSSRSKSPESSSKQLLEQMRDYQEKAQQLEAQSKFIEAFDMEVKCMELRIQIDGLSDDNMEYISQITYKANKTAMQLLQYSQPGLCEKLLLRTEKSLLNLKTQRVAFLVNLTYNNMACSFKKQGKLKLALKYLGKGIQVCLNSNEKENLAITYLNMCAILSQRQDHQEALEQASNAVNQCQEDILNINLLLKDNKSYPKHIHDLREKIALLGIAYYNMGVQEEFMGSYQRSLEWYQKAYTTIENNPDADPKLKFNFKKAVQQASLKQQMEGNYPPGEKEFQHRGKMSSSLPPSMARPQTAKTKRGQKVGKSNPASMTTGFEGVGGPGMGSNEYYGSGPKEAWSSSGFQIPKNSGNYSEDTKAHSVGKKKGNKKYKIMQPGEQPLRTPAFDVLRQADELISRERGNIMKHQHYPHHGHQREYDFEMYNKEQAEMAPPQKYESTSSKRSSSEQSTPAYGEAEKKQDSYKNKSGPVPLLQMTDFRQIEVAKAHAYSQAESDITEKEIVELEKMGILNWSSESEKEEENSLAKVFEKRDASPKKHVQSNPKREVTGRSQEKDQTYSLTKENIQKFEEMSSHHRSEVESEGNRAAEVGPPHEGESLSWHEESDMLIALGGGDIGVKGDVQDDEQREKAAIRIQSQYRCRLDREKFLLRKGKSHNRKIVYKGAYKCRREEKTYKSGNILHMLAIGGEYTAPTKKGKKYIDLWQLDFNLYSLVDKSIVHYSKEYMGKVTAPPYYVKNQWEQVQEESEGVIKDDIKKLKSFVLRNGKDFNHPLYAGYIYKDDLPKKDSDSESEEEVSEKEGGSGISEGEATERSIQPLMSQRKERETEESTLQPLLTQGDNSIRPLMNNEFMQEEVGEGDEAMQPFREPPSYEEEGGLTDEDYSEGAGSGGELERALEEEEGAHHSVASRASRGEQSDSRREGEDSQSESSLQPIKQQFSPLDYKDPQLNKMALLIQRNYRAKEGKQRAMLRRGKQEELVFACGVRLRDIALNKHKYVKLAYFYNKQTQFVRPLAVDMVDKKEYNGVFKIPYSNLETYKDDAVIEKMYLKTFRSKPGELGIEELDIIEKGGVVQVKCITEESGDGGSAGMGYQSPKKNMNNEDEFALETEAHPDNIDMGMQLLEVAPQLPRVESLITDDKYIQNLGEKEKNYLRKIVKNWRCRKFEKIVEKMIERRGTKEKIKDKKKGKKASAHHIVKIQKLFRQHIKQQFNVQLQAKLDREAEKKLIMKRGIHIGSGYYRCSVYFYSTKNNLEIVLFDVRRKLRRSFVIDGFICSEDPDILAESIEKILVKFEYDNRSAQPFLNLEDEVTNEDGPSLTVLVQHTHTLQESDKQLAGFIALAQTQKESTPPPKKNKGKQLPEGCEMIYYGNRKLDDTFYDLKVLYDGNEGGVWVTGDPVSKRAQICHNIKGDYTNFVEKHKTNRDKLGRYVFACIINSQTDSQRANGLEIEYTKLKNMMQVRVEQLERDAVEKLGFFFFRKILRMRIQKKMELAKTEKYPIYLNGLKLGGIYQMVKVLIDRHSLRNMVIIASKAINNLEITVGKFLRKFMPLKAKEVDDVGELKRMLAKGMPYILVYTPLTKKISFATSSPTKGGPSSSSSYGNSLRIIKEDSVGMGEEGIINNQKRKAANTKQTPGSKMMSTDWHKINTPHENIDEDELLTTVGAGHHQNLPPSSLQNSYTKSKMEENKTNESIKEVEPEITKNYIIVGGVKMNSSQEYYNIKMKYVEELNEILVLGQNMRHKRQKPELRVPGVEGGTSLEDQKEYANELMQKLDIGNEGQLVICEKRQIEAIDALLIDQPKYGMSETEAVGIIENRYIKYSTKKKGRPIVIHKTSYKMNKKYYYVSLYYQPLSNSRFSLFFNVQGTGPDIKSKERYKLSEGEIIGMKEKYGISEMYRADTQGEYRNMGAELTDVFIRTIQDSNQEFPNCLTDLILDLQIIIS